MSWATYITDAQTGLLRNQIDIPSISWAVSVNDSGLSTTPARAVGQDTVSNITVPWSAIPGHTAAERYQAIMPGARGLALFWQTGDDIKAGRIGIPIVWGVITNRTDSWASTTVSISSVYSLLANRYAIRDGMFHDGTSTDYVSYSGMSMRGIASEIGYLCTNAKNGGELPVDWTYRGEQHQRLPGEDASVHSRTFSAWDVQNVSGQQILTQLEQAQDGVDMQFRPYLSNDGYYVRERFVAGTDHDIYLGQDHVHSLAVFPGGGSIENVSVSYQQPVMRVYGTGSGQDKATMTALSENLALTHGTNPMVLMEDAYSDTDAKTLTILQGATRAFFNANCSPIMQIKGEIHFNDRFTPSPGEIWPGELVNLDIQGFPSLPDGVYRTRLMEMSGDSSDKATLTFDAMDVPTDVAVDNTATAEASPVPPPVKGSKLNPYTLKDFGFNGNAVVQSGDENNKLISPVALDLVGGHKYEISFEAVGSNMSVRPIFDGKEDWSQYVMHTPSDTWTLCQGILTVHGTGVVPTKIFFFVNGHSLTRIRNLRMWDAGSH